MRNKNLKTIIFAAIVIVAAFIFIWQVNEKDNGKNDNTTQSEVKKTSQTEVSYEGVAGKNALSLLKEKYKVETKTYKGLGELVVSIDGVKPDSKHFWAFYVNGKQSQTGAGAYTTKAGDKIAWKLEEIK